MREREAIARETGHRPQSHAPARPCPGPRERDQYNFTDPDSRIMKNSTNAGFDQHYNVQVAVDQASLLIVGSTLSNHPNDKAEALPTIEAIPAELGQPPPLLWIMVTIARRPSTHWKRGALNPILRRDVSPIIKAGLTGWHSNRCLSPQMRVPS